MKNINKYFFDDSKYKQKIISVTNLRLLSFEIYKIFILYISLFTISKLSYIFPFRIFFEINFNFFSFIKIYVCLLFIDICYFILFKSNSGIKSFHEFIINSISNPNIIKLLSLSLSFCLIFFCTKELKNFMPRLDMDYIIKQYELQNEEEQNEGYNDYDRYYNSDLFFAIIISGLLFSYFLIALGKFDAWPKLNLSRINNLKNNICKSFSDIIILAFPLFFIFYLFLIFFYRTLFVFNLSLNYICLFILEYIIFYISLNCINNFICASINYLSNDINTCDKLIKKEINFSKEENFYIAHYLQQIRDLYEYPRDIKFNTNLLFYENLKYLQKKINFFLDAINRKYSYSFNKNNYSYIKHSRDIFDSIKNSFEKIYNDFDFSVNQILQKETCVQNIKFLIEIIGNVIIFISDAKINKKNEDKYNECKEYSYYFVDKLIDIDSMLVNLIQNKKISQNIKNDLKRLKYIIKNYFDLIRHKQMKNKFLKLISQKLRLIIDGNNIN